MDVKRIMIISIIWSGRDHANRQNPRSVQRHVTSGADTPPTSKRQQHRKQSSTVSGGHPLHRLSVYASTAIGHTTRQQQYRPTYLQ